MQITSFIHPVRTYLPCSGAGRFINNTLLELNQREDIDLSLLFSKQWLQRDGKLDSRSPLRNISFNTFPWPENLAERALEINSIS